MNNNAMVAVKDSTSMSNELIQLVSFSLNDQEYGVEVTKVREIIRMTGITSMPNSPPHVDGIINLRGKVIPIVSLRRRFNLMDAENSNMTRIIVMDMCGELTGFVVDAVSEVIRVSDHDIQPPPSVSSTGDEQDCITGVVKRAERLMVLMDLDRMFTGNDRNLLGQM